MTQIKATLIDHMGSDISTVNAARVSFGKQSTPVKWDWYEYESGGASGDFIAVLKEGDVKLIKYLAKHKHLSPFGHAFASFRVKAPIFVARQLVKHKFLRWNEISRRYVDDDPEFYVPEIWRGRSADKKQGSEGVVDVSDLNHHGEDFNGDFGEWTLQERLYGKASDDLELYDILIKAGVAPEQARGILPQSTLTEWYWSGSLDAFAAMCRLRCAPDSQYESRIVADQISKVLGELFPVSWSALMESDA
jgi:thymidylate synthase (FAD)